MTDQTGALLHGWTLVGLAAVQQSLAAYDTRIWDELRGYVWPELSGYVDMCSVLEDLGRVRCPLPVHSGLIQVDAALAALGDDGLAHRRRLLTGSTRYAIGMHDRAGLPAPGNISVTAGQDADGRWYVSGAVRHVMYGDSANLLLVPAKAGSRLVLAAVPTDARGLRATTHSTIAADRLTDFAFSYTPVEPGALLAGEPENDQRARNALQAAAAVGVMAHCAETVGLSAGLLEATVARVKSRMAFGGPLAALQSVQLRTADMYLDLTASRQAVRELAEMLATDPPESLTPVVSAAKITVTTAALRIAAAAHQLCGGWGQLDEAGLHHFTRAIKAAEGQLGSPAFHRARIGLLLAGAPSL